jgi:hypothetical protein
LMSCTPPPLPQTSAPPAGPLRQFVLRAKALASPFAAADRPARPAGAAAAAPAPAAGAAAGPNPLLADLPGRRPAAHTATAATALRRHSSNSTAAAVAAAAAAAAAAGSTAAPAAAAATAAGAVLPPEVPPHVEAAARELHLLSRPPALSKLHHIVMSYLRQQHRQAVMQSAVPTAMLPPIPLSRPYVMPQVVGAGVGSGEVEPRDLLAGLMGGVGVGGRVMGKATHST